MRELRRFTEFLRAELRSTSSLLPLIGLSVLIVFFLTRGSVTLAHPSFQSPIATPTPAPEATSTPLPAETPTTPAAEPTATEEGPPPAEPTPTVGPPPEEPAPTEGAPPEEPTPAEGPPPEEPPPGEEPPAQEPAPTEEPPAEEPAATPVPEEESPSSSRGSRAILIDTFLVGFSSLWLCCGAIVLVLFALGVVASFFLRRV